MAPGQDEMALLLIRVWKGGGQSTTRVGANGKAGQTRTNDREDGRVAVLSWQTALCIAACMDRSRPISSVLHLSSAELGCALKRDKKKESETREGESEKHQRKTKRLSEVRKRRSTAQNKKQKRGDSE